MQVLIERIKSNDRKAQEILYKKYADRFFYCSLRYTGNSNDAAEVLNSGFFKIFSKIHSFYFINNQAFEGWMYKILINEALMFLRQSTDNLINTEIDPMVQSSTYSDHHFSEEDCLKLLQMLPAGYRTVFKAPNNDPNFLSWKTGTLTFNNVPLEYVVKVMEDYYGTSISIEKEENKYCRFTSQLKNIPLKEALQMIETTLALKVKQRGLMYSITGKGC